MALHRALKQMLQQTIHVAPAGALDDYGQPTPGTPVAVKARVELKSGKTENSDGTQRTTSHFIVTETAVAMTDLVWLPGDSTADASKARTPAEVQAHPDGRGNTSHYEIKI